MNSLVSSWRKFSGLLRARSVLRLSPEQLHILQRRRLRRILRYAYEQVPHYRRAWDDAGVRPEDVRGVEDLPLLPMVEKADVQRDPDGFLARGTVKERCLVQRTTGSSGKPLRVYYSDRDDSVSKAVNMRSFMANGFRPWHRWIFIQDPIWSDRRYIIGRKYFFQRRLRLFDPLDVNVHLPVEEQVRMIRAHGCDCLHGYPSSLLLIAKYMERNGIDDIRPKVVVTTGELLPPDLRAYLDRIFGVPLADFIGTTEFNRIAWECERHEGYHIDADSVVIEFLRDGRPVGPGEEGEMVLTGLYNRTMPLIRYRLKDVGVLLGKACSCGRPLPLMRQIQGRCDDFLVAASGRRFSPMSVWSVMRHHTCMQDFHILQEAPGTARLTAVKSPDAAEEDVLAAARELEAVLGGEIALQVCFADHVEKNKLRAVESRVAGGTLGAGEGR